MCQNTLIIVNIFTINKRKMDMKALITLTFLISLLGIQPSLANQIPDGKVSTYYDNGNKKADKQYSDGVPIGTWKSWYKGGEPHATIIFLDDTGQIKEIEARYLSGALLFKGIATIKESLKEKQEKYMTIKFGKECKGIASKKDDGNKWYSNYELEFYSFYEDGSCEQAVADNMHRLIAQMYIRITDITTGNVYDFPWNKMWGTVPNYLKEKFSKDFLSCAADRMTINSMMKEMGKGSKNFLEKVNEDGVLWSNSMLQYLTKVGLSNKEAEIAINNAIKESFDKHVKAIKDFGSYEDPSEVFEKAILPKLRDCYKSYKKSE